MFFALSFRWYHSKPFTPAASRTATNTFTIGDPTSPISIAGAEGDAERRFFGLGVPSRLIRIIVLQSSSGPSPQPPPAGRRCLRSSPYPLLRHGVRSSETGSEYRPVEQIPVAVLRA